MEVQRTWASEAEWRASLPVGALVNAYPLPDQEVVKTLEERLRELPLPKLRPQVTEREKAWDALVAAIQAGAGVAAARAAYDAAPPDVGPTPLELVPGDEPVVWVTAGSKMLPAFFEGNRILVRHVDHYYALDAPEAGVDADAAIWKTTPGGILVKV